MTPGTTAATILYVLLAILCIASNSLVCYLITKRKILYNVLKYYILSLAFADLFVGIISIPLYIFILTNIVPKGSSFSLYNILYSLDLLQLSSGQIDTALNIFKWMQYLNSVCNPFIYAIFHPNVRSAITTISSKCFKCKQVVPE